MSIRLGACHTRGTIAPRQRDGKSRACREAGAVDKVVPWSAPAEPVPYTDYLLRLRSRAGLGLNTRDRPGVEPCPEGHTENSLALQRRVWHPPDFPSPRDGLESGHVARQRRAGIPTQGQRSAALGTPPIIPTRPAKGGSIFLSPKGNAHQMPSRSASTKGDLRPCRAQEENGGRLSQGGAPLALGWFAARFQRGRHGQPRKTIAIQPEKVQHILESEERFR